MADQARHLISWDTVFGVEKFSVSLKEAFIAQLEKDLQHTFENVDSEDFFKEALAVVSYAVEHNKLSDFLYRVDLSETQAMRCMASSDPVHSLTQAILERVAQKVIFRRQYSGK